jgi:hypothetical protein
VASISLAPEERDIYRKRRQKCFEFRRNGILFSTKYAVPMELTILGYKNSYKYDVPTELQNKFKLV